MKRRPSVPFAVRQAHIRAAYRLIIEIRRDRRRALVEFQESVDQFLTYAPNATPSQFLGVFNKRRVPGVINRDSTPPAIRSAYTTMARMQVVEPTLASKAMRSIHFLVLAKSPRLEWLKVLIQRALA